MKWHEMLAHGGSQHKPHTVITLSARVVIDARGCILGGSPPPDKHWDMIARTMRVVEKEARDEVLSCVPRILRGYVRRKLEQRALVTGIVRETEVLFRIGRIAWIRTREVKRSVG